MSEFATQYWPSTTVWKGTGRPCRPLRGEFEFTGDKNKVIHKFTWECDITNPLTVSHSRVNLRINREFEDYHRQARKVCKRGDSLWHWSPRQLSPEVCGNSYAEFEYVFRDHLFSLLLRYKNPVIVNLVFKKITSYERLLSTPTISLQEADNL